MEPQHIRSATERKLGLLRANEARSADTTEQRLRELAVDPVRAVRLWTARNPNTPPDAVALLLHDSDPSVQNSALFHLRAPAAALELLARQEAAEAEAAQLPHQTAKRDLVAHHPNTPPELRDQLLAAGVCRACPESPCTTAEYFNRRQDGNPYVPRGRPTSAPDLSSQTGGPRAMGDVAGIEPTADSEDWWSLLGALDEPGRLGRAAGLEVPSSFDRAATQNRFDQLVKGLSKAFGCPLVGGHGPQQDAARFGVIRIPAEVTRTYDQQSGARLPLAVMLSNFGALTTCLPYRFGPAPDVGPTPPVHQEDYRRIEQVSAELQLRLVPEYILDAPYDGPNEWVFEPMEATWFRRFFDYL
ncbi:hypothetical protein Axi01nite_82340 [Actinoplanes xinjiangensis]|nr:hypothetical protein Axi01nite_82340 [Actinoplanes xinjiangensis]